jgi:hypothetical protein
MARSVRMATNNRSLQIRYQDGIAYLWTRAGWRPIRDGHILTRRGWRKLMKRGKLKPTGQAVLDALWVKETLTADADKIQAGV